MNADFSVDVRSKTRLERPKVDLRKSAKICVKRDFAVANTYDYIIIGAGSAGCVLANRLSADPNVSVLLLEAGGKDNWHWFHIPVGYLYCIGNPRADWCFKTEPEPGLNGRAINYPRGKVLGGSSSINAMLYLRGQARDYDEWAMLTGDSGWSWQNVLPTFMDMEDHWRGGDEKHGTGNELHVDTPRVSWEIIDAFRDAAVENGIPRVDDFNRGDNEGVSRFDVTQKDGVRWSGTKAFLRPAMARPNLTVITGALTHKLRLEGRRVTGVEYSRGGAMHYAQARRETILSAGAIGSPQILQLSGIGPAPLLKKLGIPLVHDLPVGENLQDHLQLRLAYKIQGAMTLNTMLDSWWYKNENRTRIRAASHRPHDHAAVADRSVRQIRSVAAHRQSRIPRPADFAESLWRAAAQIPRLHRQRVQSAPDLARICQHHQHRPARAAGHRAELFIHRCGPQDRHRFNSRHAPHRAGK